MKRPHYAWLVCLGGALVLFSTVGLGVNVFTIYQPEIIRVNDFTNAQGSWITTIRSLMILLSLFTVNRLCARLGVRLVMTLGTALMALSCLCFALASSFFVYGCAAALAGIGYCYGGMVPLSLVIGSWFRDRRGLALGLASAGSGISTIFAPTLITRLIQSQGLRAAFLWEGGVVLITALLAWALIRNSPAQLGLEPYHLGGTQAPVSPPKKAPAGMTPRYTLLLLIAAFLVGGPGGPGFSHLTVLYTKEGYDSGLLALLMSYAGFVIFLGKIICGQVYDRMGSRWGNCYAFGATIGGLLLCCLAPLQSLWLPFLAITLIGLGLPLSSLSPTVWASDLYSDEGYARAVQVNSLVYMVGVLVLGPLPGILADRFDSYVPAYALFSLMTAAALALLQILYHRLHLGGRPKTERKV
ncbi:MFS transporter [Pseudoflavonifractor sp. AF19-9AC]|uniref:MFS transporter n=1 Tax=Pseudoflavonifractor sp. AF19-9AC TaxID=2292244 RepID=UPI000E48853A|nr:MFS transporter [Pseudoflavonifractor sp. AF19-9AC]RHR08897.1 MFS transporter [Pseudoflavonifractor sp. AF19-9AC]